MALIGLASSPMQAVSEPSYPSRPVRIIVPSEAGGGTDISARVLADRLAQSTGQQFYIENRPGAAGMLGIEIAGPCTERWIYAADRGEHHHHRAFDQQQREVRYLARFRADHPI
ncbi:MAG: hypothetical protein ACJ8FA_16215, partial [Xanthobacteraceae bacterium]